MPSRGEIHFMGRLDGRKGRAQFGWATNRSSEGFRRATVPYRGRGLTPKIRLRSTLLATLVVSIVAVPMCSAAQCDPTRGHGFLFSADTGVATLSLKTLQPTPQRNIATGRGTLRLLDETAVAVTVRGRIHSSTQIVTYKLKS